MTDRSTPPLSTAAAPGGAPPDSGPAAIRTAGIEALEGLPAPDALLFDLDGTLVDTVPVRIEAWRRALEEGGIAVDPSLIAGYIGSDGRWLAREMAAATGQTLDEPGSDRLDRRHGELFDQLNLSPRPLSGARELLTALERSRLTFAIATSSQAGQVRVSVEALELPAPPPVVNGGHVALAKPAPDLLLAGAAELRVAPDRCWYVGDSCWDMLAAERAGMAAIGVTTGAVDRQALVDAGAQAVVENLLPILAELRRRGLVEQARAAGDRRFEDHAPESGGAC